jgi:hypothetical protein
MNGVISSIRRLAVDSSNRLPSHRIYLAEVSRPSAGGKGVGDEGWLGYSCAVTPEVAGANTWIMRQQHRCAPA